MNTRIIVKAWSKKTKNQSSPRYGIRISKKDRNLYFSNIDFIDIWIGELSIIRISANEMIINEGLLNYGEIGNPSIAQFLIQNGLDSWPKGQPPSLVLIQIDDQAYRLDLLSNS